MFKIILWSDYFERTLVWTMVWNSSGQWSGTCLIRGHFGLELAWSEAASSALRAHNDLRAHSRLIRGHYRLGRSDQRSHLSGTVWSEAISSATSTWVFYSCIRCWFAKSEKIQLRSMLLKHCESVDIASVPVFTVLWSASASSGIFIQKFVRVIVQINKVIHFANHAQP